MSSSQNFFVSTSAIYINDIALLNFHIIPSSVSQLVFIFCYFQSTVVTVLTYLNEDVFCVS